jgi:hypothetical protein
MTSVWGPLGWMTLHSVASLYPDMPTETERQLMTTWLDLFRDTITCPSCQGHFTELLSNYRAQFPNMLYSRRDFLLFTFRAHNAVNRRIGKPIYSTVQECFDLLRNNVKFNKTVTFRISYVNRITMHWRVFQDASGLTAMKRIHQIKKIEMQYMTARSNEFEVGIPEDDVVMNIGAQPMLTLANGQPIPQPTVAASGGSRMTMQGGRLRLRR